MPIYEFHCKSCGTDAEILVRSSNWTGTQCPKCHSTQLEKKLSVFASSVAGNASPASAGAGDCSGNPRSCGLCGTGKAHSH